MTPRLLASTKFSVPALPRNYVPRPRLHAALDAGSALPLTIVVGVPGAGKSVMLKSWLHDRLELPSIWLSCDAFDANPVTFWLALVAALTHAWPDRWLDVADLLAERELDLDDVAISIVNDLADLGEAVVLVIDDFHFAAAAASSLLTLIERLPTGCRVVLGSRTEPQLALHRLRARGQLLEVRDAELRLTPTEVAAVLREFEVELSESEIEVLATHTDGWTAGVQMAAVALRDQSAANADHFLAELSKTPRAITDFLGTEVLDRQPVDIHDFLLDTSILDVLDAESCAAVTGRPDSDAFLRLLEARNLFLIQVEQGSYRYHHLFADLLRHRLGAEDPDRKHALHRRAAAYFVETGDAENAISHFLSAGQDGEAFEVFRTHVVDAFYEGDGRKSHRMFAQLESHGSTTDPAYLPDLALAVAASGPAGAAQPWIARARKHATALSEAARARLSVAQALVALQYGEAGDIERALSACPRATNLSDESLVCSVPSLQVRSRLWLGDVQGAREICEEGLDRFDDPSVPQVVMTSALAWVACVEGHLTEAEQYANRALASAQSMGLSGNPVMEAALSAKGRIAFERGDLHAAEQLFEQAIAMSEDVRPAFASVNLILLSRALLAQGLVGEALDGITRARAFLAPAPTSPLLGLCDALEGRIAAEIGDLHRAERCAQRLEPGNRAAILQTRIALACGEWNAAREALARCAPATLRERLDVAVLAARIAHGCLSDDADAMLAAALELAEAEGFVVAVTDDMAELRPRIALLLRSGHIGDYEQAVLDRLENALPSVRMNDGRIGPLSTREMTVVRYLASRLTYREIAGEIYVSTNTLKTHVKRIYGKLGVSSRSEAVGEARRLGVL